MKKDTAPKIYRWKQAHERCSAPLAIREISLHTHQDAEMKNSDNT